MIALVDELLRAVILRDVRALAPGPGETAVAGQVRFQPPDADFRAYVTNLHKNAISIYLIELGENRHLRSNERFREDQSGRILHRPAPARLDCHYLISAQSAATPSEAVEPALDEHRILYDVASALLRRSPLNARRTYEPGPVPRAWPADYHDYDFPVTIASPEGFTKLAEFWGTMGQEHRWKPVLHVVVTIPIALEVEIAGPPVLTRILEDRRFEDRSLRGERIAIGGAVRRGAAAESEATVSIETASGAVLAHAESDASGRFVLGDVAPGAYVLRARARDGREITRAVDVPAPDGNYDVHLA